MKSHHKLPHPQSCLCLVHGEPDMNPQQDPVQTFQLTPRGTALCLSAGIGDPRDPDPWDIVQHHLGRFKCMLHIQPPLHCLAVHKAWFLPARCLRCPHGLMDWCPSKDTKVVAQLDMTYRSGPSARMKPCVFSAGSTHLIWSIDKRGLGRKKHSWHHLTLLLPLQ